MALTPQPSKTKPHLAKMRDRARYGRIVRRARKARRGINPLGVGLPEQRRVYRRFIRALAQSTVPQAIAFVGLGDGFELAEVATCMTRRARIAVLLSGDSPEQQALERRVWDYLKAGQCRSLISRVRPGWNRWILRASGHILLGRIVVPPGVPVETFLYAVDILVPLCTPSTRITLFRPPPDAPDSLYCELAKRGWAAHIECSTAFVSPPHP